MKSKLVKCKTCGAEIAKSAKKCSNCGAPQHRVAITIASLLGMLAVFCTIMVIVNAVNSGSSSSPNQNGSGSSSQESSAIQISSIDLWKAYADNEVNADNLYKDKLLSVTGTISDIGKDVVTKNPCVTLKAGDQLGIYSVQCFFPDADEKSSTLAALKDGQKITIYGTCDGTPLENVQLSNCYLTE